MEFLVDALKLLVLIALVIATWRFLSWGGEQERKRLDAMTEEEREEWWREQPW